MLKYFMGLARKNDPTMRLKYATHLVRHKETSQEAIVQYDKVLEQQPRNPEAHQGLQKPMPGWGTTIRPSTPQIPHGSLQDGSRAI